ncbi:MAG: nitroreductase family protein [Candidatus Nanoarchaeia archaeon]|nr:nitroreductase family protein [Candidatus Nanoarchaeia archaeon]
MNEFLDFINTRRSIRKYKQGEISEEQIKQILEAGMQAPSARNQQPWHFIVVKDKEIIEKIIEAHPNASMAKQASFGILVCGDLNLETAEGMWIQDCSAATQNILLAVHALNLGAVWTGVYPREERMEGFKKLFDLSENIIPFSFIPIGYPDEKSSKADRFKKERIHYDKW